MWVGRDGNTYYSQAQWDAANRAYDLRNQSTDTGFDDAFNANVQQNEEIMAGYQDMRDTAATSQQQTQDTYAGQVGDIRQQYRDAQARQNETLNQDTGQRQRDIRRDYSAEMGRQQASLGERGMAGTTIGSTMRRGIVRDRQNALNRLNDNLISQRMGMNQNYDMAGIGNESRGYAQMYNQANQNTANQANMYQNQLNYQNTVQHQYPQRNRNIR